jgi:hypothetical protein
MQTACQARISMRLVHVEYSDYILGNQNGLIQS